MSKNAHHLNWPFAFPTYPGGKGGDCVYQSIINLIPEHDTFISLFTGGGFVENYKRLAKKTILIDADETVIRAWSSIIPDDMISREIVSLIHGDCFAFLRQLWFDYVLNNPRTFIFADPPYLGEVRADKRKVYYKHELRTRAEHSRLLLYLGSPAIKAKVMLCAYQSSLYDHILIDLLGWHKSTYMGRTRGGMREETIYMNFDPMEYPLHDYRYIGDNARERHRIKKKVNREIAKLARLDQREREAILHAINQKWTIYT